MLVIPRRNITVRRPDRLITELSKVEGRLQAWIAASDRNEQLFRRDPIAAMRKAGLEISRCLV